MYVWNCRMVKQKMILAYFPNTDPNVPANLMRVKVRDAQFYTKTTRNGPGCVYCCHDQNDLYNAVKHPKKPKY